MRPLRVGLVFDLLGSLPVGPNDPPDAEAEYEPEETLEILEAALRFAGHEPLRLGNPHELLDRAGKGNLPRVDAALNIAEGRGSRNREAWAPVLLEMLAIPTLGSDALSLSLSLDKALAKTIVADVGVPVTPHAVVPSPEALVDASLPGPFPLFVKPVAEGTAKGIAPSSRVVDPKSLEREVERIVRDYCQPALIEPFLEGPEYTVSVIGNDPPTVLPVLQRALEVDTRIGLHALERHLSSAPSGGWEHCVSGSLDPALEELLEALTRHAFRALGCRDFARADFRLDGGGRPHFLEMNPLPAFGRGSSFESHAELRGQPLPELLAEVFAVGLRRLGFS